MFDASNLHFQHLGRDNALKIIVFSDASFGNLSDGETQGGHVILLMGEDGQLPFLGNQRELRGLCGAHLPVKHWQWLMELIMPFL